MKRKTHILIPLALMAFSTSGWTAMADNAEATIRLMEASEAEDSSEVTRVISLPEHLYDPDHQSKAVDNAEKGLQNASDNVHKNDLPDNANDRAREAREAAGEMSEQAKENRANRGRSGDRPDPPNRPENPGPPENPGGN